MAFKMITGETFENEVVKSKKPVVVGFLLLGANTVQN